MCQQPPASPKTIITMPVRTVESPSVTESIKELALGSPPVLSPAQILASLSMPEKVFLLSGSSFTRTPGIARHGLNPVKVSDGPTDVRGDGVFNAPPSIVLPNATCLASTWDVELIQQAGQSLAGEAAHKTVDIMLAPTLNLHRDPRGGRNQESYGEDPFLAGKCGAAFAKGVQSRGVAICAKHLVCNDSETERRYYNVDVDERTLREVYLRPFEIMVKEANPKSIMTAYNKINGDSAAENQHTMGIVRDEWKWDGLFMSDWFGTYNGVKSIKAGLDLEMPFPAARGPNLLSAIAKGEMAESELDAPALKVIKFLQDLGAPTDTVRGPDKPSPMQAKDIAVNRRAAAEGIVLLQNQDSILPLDAGSKETIGVIGSLATDRVITQLICASYLVNPLEGIKTALASSPGKLRHAHGVQTHKVVPKLGPKYTNKVMFHKWNLGDRVAKRTPVCTDVYAEALEAMFMRPMEGLDSKYEIEMVAEISVPISGLFVLSVIAAHDAEVFIDGESVFQYSPGGLVDIQRFLFHYHEVEKTFVHSFEAGKTYDVRVICQSQPQSGNEPVAQGMIFGMVENVTREESIAEAVAIAKESDKVLLFVGTTSEWEMEGVDRKDLALPAGQDELIRAVLAVNPKTIVVNQSGSAVDLSVAKEASAIVHAHFNGQEAGNAIADVLFGRVNPSGRTSYTWPVRLEHHSSYSNFPCSSDLSIKYAEGVDVGYRGYLRNNIKPAFAFGHGLSYTAFDYSQATLSGSLSAGSIRVQVKITNRGGVAGREVVQVYVRTPVSSSAVKTLEGFAKTRLLAPGDSETVAVVLPRRSFSYWDTERDSWVIQPGPYVVELAKSAEETIVSVEHQVETESTWQGLN